MKCIFTLLLLISFSVHSSEFVLPKLSTDVFCWDEKLSNKNIKLCNQRLFIDVDFDGEVEIVERNFRAGQRHRDSFTIYKHRGLERDGKQLQIMDFPPFNLVDSATVFNSVHKTIRTELLGGACATEIHTHKKINNNWLISKKEIYESDKEGNCQKSIYEINRNLKLVLVSKMRSE
jgi:hypothetical protein